MGEISRAEQALLSDRAAADRCGIPPSTFAQMIRTEFGDKRQQPNPDFLPSIAAGLGIPLEDLLDSAAWVAGYRRRRLDESDLLSVVRFWLTDDLDSRTVRDQIREARNRLIHGLDHWAEEHGGLFDVSALEDLRHSRDSIIKTLDRLAEKAAQEIEEEIAADEAADWGRD